MTFLKQNTFFNIAFSSRSKSLLLIFIIQRIYQFFGIQLRVSFNNELEISPNFFKTLLIKKNSLISNFGFILNNIYYLYHCFSSIKSYRCMNIKMIHLMNCLPKINCCMIFYINYSFQIHKCLFIYMNFISIWELC